MPEDMSWDSELLDIPFVIFTIWCLWYLWFLYKREKRKEGLSRLASRLGFSFTAKEQLEAENLPHTELFSYRMPWLRNKTMLRNVLRGNFDETEVKVFEFTCNIGRSSFLLEPDLDLLSSYFYQTVAVFRFNDRLPAFRLRPRTRQGSISSKLHSIGYKDLSWHVGTVFSSRYQLEAEDSQPVLDLFLNSPLIDFFNHSSGRWWVESRGGSLVIYERGRVVEPEAMVGFIESSKNLWRLFSTQAHKP